MKSVSKKLFSLLLVVVMLASVVPFQTFADGYCRNSEHADASTDIRCVDNGAKHVSYCTTEGCPDAGKPVYGSGVQHNGADCTVCGYTAPVVCAHNDCTTTVTKAATCEDKGEQKTVCNTCGETVNVAEVPALGHKDVNGDKLCDVCGKYLGTGSDVQPTGTLRLVANGGTVSVTEMNVAYGKALNTFGALPIPSREGYDFDGWFLDDVTPVSGATVCSWENGTKTAYAHWTLRTKTLTVRVLFEDGSVATQIIYDKGVTEGTNLLKFLNNDPEIQQRIASYKNSHPGYDWYEEYFYDYSGTQPLTSQDQKLNRAQDVYIRFVAKSYTLNFDAGYGAVCATSSKTVKYNKHVGPLPTPTKAGSVFAGWVDYTDGGKIYESNKTLYLLTRDTTLTAVWSDKAVVVLHVYLNGSFITSDDYVLDGYANKNPLTGNYDSVTRDAVAKFVTARYTPNSGTSLQIDGLFSSATWADYKKNTSIKGVPSIQINDVDVQNNHPTDVYIMIRNAHRGGGYTPTTPWDPSNPKTGDNAALLPMASVMLLAAAGFVTLAAVRKKKFN